ncbi:MAG TPA: hypothetical protein VGD88_09525 [Opitutaceae bacterium]
MSAISVNVIRTGRSMVMPLITLPGAFDIEGQRAEEGQAEFRCFQPKPTLAQSPPPAYRSDVTPKQKAIQALGTLPENASYEQLQEEVRILAALEEAEADIRDGRVVAHDDVKRRLAKWTSS